MKRIEEIYRYICEKDIEQSKENISYDMRGTTAAEIEEKFCVVRNNASTLLNRLAEDGKLIKLSGRPVKFVSAEQRNLWKEKQIQEKTEIQDEQQKDPFEALIGWQESLRLCVLQAKSAMIYPPNGLHTLILGKSGVGKSLFARTMYEYARRVHQKKEAEFPFVSFNCADYYNNPQLLHAHLFGYIKGAFTGALEEKPGLVEAANGGVLFLDEVHRLPPSGQEMLFTLIDKGEYSRLGESERSRKSNVLIIAATTENPEKTLLTTFRRRIEVTIELPSFIQRGVHERREIVEYLFEKESQKIGMPIEVERDIMDYFVSSASPGNIGQIKSDIKQICAKAFLHKAKEETNLHVGSKFLSKEKKAEKEEQSIGSSGKNAGTKQMILVICSSGAGSGKVFLETVQKLIEEYGSDMEASVLPYQTVVRKGDDYLAIESEYEIVAGIGNMNPGLDIPYFDMTEVLSNRKDNEFKKFLCEHEKKEERDGFHQAYKLLEETTLALNPYQAIKNVHKFLKKLGIDSAGLLDSDIVKLTVHIGYMLERLITGQYIHHAYKEELLSKYEKEIAELQAGCGVLNDIYHIQITEDELCFLVDLMAKLHIWR